MDETATAPSPRRFSLSHLILVVPWVALVIDAWAPIRDNSFLWHIRAGELQASAGEVLTADPFSFTMLGTPWLTQSWLGELLYGWGESATNGLGFVPGMMLVLSSIAFLSFGLVAYRRSRSVSVTAFLLVLTTLLFLSFLVPRPVIFSYALFGLVILAWGRPATHWTLPFLFWVWASVHGSFALGLVYIGLSILAEREWKRLGVAIVSGLVTLATAHGLGVIQMLLSFADSGEALALLSEWRKPEYWSVVGTPFLVGVALIVAGAFRGHIRPKHLWIIVPFVALGLGATRAIPPAWIALLPLLGLALRDVHFLEHDRFGMGPAIVFGVAVAIAPFLVKADAPLDEERFPIAAREALEPVPTFHDDRAGGYLIWADGPDRLVYIDDRAELYQERLVEFAGVRDGDVDWEPVFERDGIEQVLLRADESLIEDISEAGWSKSYEDEFYVILRP